MGLQKIYPGKPKGHAVRGVGCALTRFPSRTEALYRSVVLPFEAYSTKTQLPLLARASYDDSHHRGSLYRGKSYA